jgi:hypothetical protein
MEAGGVSYVRLQEMTEGGGSGSYGRGEGQEGLEDALCSSGIRSAAAV